MGTTYTPMNIHAQTMMKVGQMLSAQPRLVFARRPVRCFPSRRVSITFTSPSTPNYHHPSSSAPRRLPFALTVSTIDSAVEVGLGRSANEPKRCRTTDSTSMRRSRPDEDLVCYILAHCSFLVRLFASTPSLVDARMIALSLQTSFPSHGAGSRAPP